MQGFLYSSLIAAAAAGAVALSFAFWPDSEPSLISRGLLAGVAFVAVAGALLSGLERSRRAGRAPWTPWIVCGALGGAAALSILAAAVWISLAALLFAAAGAVVGVRGRRGLCARLAVTLAVGLLSLAIAWWPQFGGYGPISAADYRVEGLHLDALLSDVPLHDAWEIRLRGGADRTIEDLRAMARDPSPGKVTPVVLGLLALRGLLGALFGWDAEVGDEAARTYLNRLSEEERERSLVEPGLRRGAFRCLFVFEREALFEIINPTVHAFLALSMVPSSEGQTLYMAIYVKPAGRATRHYMALVDPFRRLFVYPAAVRLIEHDWAERWGASGRGP